MIFVVRKYNIRAYAFSPTGYEAAIRIEHNNELKDRLSRVAILIRHG